MLIFGDTHGEKDVFAKILSQAKPNDIIMICGDCGLLFFDNITEYNFLNQLAQEPYTICFCDGNHENFTAIYRYPCEEWNGGKVHRIRNNIFHLMRGQVFTIEGKKIFTMGGAYSRDKYRRQEGISWWKEELPTKEEYNEAIKNLTENNFSVDYVISHTAPSEIIRRMGYNPTFQKDSELTGFLEWVMYETKYKQWFFGHWHIDQQIDEKHRAVFDESIRI